MQTGQAASGRIGVLIANLGTPDATDFWSMRRYLKEFLSDKRVIEQDTLLWKLIFNGIILTLRPARKGRDYDTIWNREKNESPLKTITRVASGKTRSVARLRSAHRCRLGHALRQSVGWLSASMCWPRKAAIASCSCRFIRNMPRRHRPRRVTPCSGI